MFSPGRSSGVTAIGHGDRTEEGMWKDWRRGAVARGANNAAVGAGPRPPMVKRGWPRASRVYARQTALMPSKELLREVTSSRPQRGAPSDSKALASLAERGNSL